VWLRSPISDVPAELQPVAHGLLRTCEEVEELLARFPDRLLWERPANVASVGFHLQHLSGVIDRLLTYARGGALSPVQLQALASEAVPSGPDVGGRDLVAALKAQVDRAIDRLRTTDVRTLTEPRGVGRGQLPSTVFGLLSHAAEHAQRHVGQLLVTIRVVNQEP